MTSAEKAGRHRRLLVACVQRLQWAQVTSLWSLDLDVSRLVAEHMPTESRWELSRTNEVGAGGLWACGNRRVDVADFCTHSPHELGGAFGMLEGEELRLLKANMLASTATFAAVTWALGIGDRHSDNVFLSIDGVLLSREIGRAAFGNCRSKFGIKRREEKVCYPPFIIEALGGPKSDDCVLLLQQTCQAFHAIRQRTQLLSWAIELEALVAPSALGVGSGVGGDELEYVKSRLCGEDDADVAAALFEDAAKAGLKPMAMPVIHTINFS